MSKEVSRRSFIKTSVAVIGTTALPFNIVTAQNSVKHRRYNVTSNEGKKALASYAKGIQAMLKLPADHPQNWYRNAFVHLMDCPHGNWWFYVWHRGYLGYFEETIRNLSGDESFTIPYWDWTSLPQIPDDMFGNLLSPNNPVYEAFTRNLADFTSFIRPALSNYWKGFDSSQLAQLKTRGYPDLETVWNDVTGFDPKQKDPHGVSGNIAYANPCGSRYLTRDNPKLDEKTAYNVSPFVVYAGLMPTDFYNKNNIFSFNSSKTPSHNSPPGGKESFSVLEGLPHNKVHNYIGGVGPLDPGPYGFMTNFLSPLDPIFFLHHANIDRLWDVWTRKQMHLGLPYLPTGSDLTALSNEPFLFFVNGKGNYVGKSQAADYISMTRFDYDYEPGFGEQIVGQSSGQPPKQTPSSVVGAVTGNSASFTVPSEAIRRHLSAELGTSLVANITLPRPSADSIVREFDVLVGAPVDVKKVGANSPYYAGTIAFFGSMRAMSDMQPDVGFAVPLPKKVEAFHGLGITENAPINIRIVPSHDYGQKTPNLKSVSISVI